jgi:hypothetical protein
MGGSGASGGAGPCTPDLMIDDMEDGDDDLCPNRGLAGDWWNSKGLSGTLTPIDTEAMMMQAYPLGANAREGSAYGMYLSGTGFSATTEDWALLGFNFVNDATYDVTGHQGIAFFAKSGSGTLTLRLSIATPVTIAVEQGGTCTSLCFDHYHYEMVIGTSWQELRVPFSSMVQEGWGPAPRDFAHAMWVTFTPAVLPSSFEFFIDDVSFY